MTTVTVGLCDLCGNRGPIRAALVAWTSTVLPFGSVDRCEDEPACRARVLARGDEWPIRERTEDIDGDPR